MSLVRCAGGGSRGQECVALEQYKRGGYQQLCDGIWHGADGSIGARRGGGVFVRGDFREWGEDATVIVESIVVAANTNQLVKFLVGRERPFVHDLDADGKGRTSTPGDNNLSFYSGHTMLGFVSAVSAGTIASLKGYRAAPVIWGTGLTFAAATGYLRIAADKHYFTDVVTGAVMGSLAGFLVPWLHRPKSTGAQETDGNDGRSRANGSHDHRVSRNIAVENNNITRMQSLMPNAFRAVKELIRFDSVFWRKFMVAGIKHEPEAFVKHSPPAFGIAFGLALPEARRRVQASLEHLLGRRSAAQEALEVAEVFSNYAHCLTEAMLLGVDRGYVVRPRIVESRML